jgi:hypothetical protein
MNLLKNTIEKTRTYKGLENLSDIEIKNILRSLKQLAQITFEFYRRHTRGCKLKNIDNQDIMA